MRNRHQVKLSFQFDQCANKIKYNVAGEEVNYKFVELKNTLFIYFEGSNGKLDWLRNFNFFSITTKVPYKDMEVKYKVHRGFLKSWKEIEDIIISKIKEKDEDSYKWKHIVVIGYSHGAALAQLCHESIWFHREDLRKNGFKSYCFEAPRVYKLPKYDSALRLRWNNCITIRNSNDIVTHVPPLLFGFEHVGKMIEIGQNKKYGHFNSIKAHYPQNVLESLKEYEEEFSK